MTGKDGKGMPGCGTGGSGPGSGPHDEVTCRKLILEFLFEFESGAMPADERQALERHFDECPPCGVFLTSYRATGKTLRMLKPSEVPADLALAVVQFVRARSGKS